MYLQANILLHFPMQKYFYTKTGRKSLILRYIKTITGSPKAIKKIRMQANSYLFEL